MSRKNMIMCKKLEICQRAYYSELGGPYQYFKAVGGRETDTLWNVTINIEHERTREDWVKYFQACAEAASLLPDVVK